MSDININSSVINFFTKNIRKVELESSIIFFCRGDGVPIYFHSGEGAQIDKPTVGALLVGAWQASKALSSFIPNGSKDSVFRLNFDTSSSGLYALPVDLYGQEYYIGIIYHGQLAPGKIKATMRNLSTKLKFSLDKQNNVISNTRHSDNEEEYLFKDISDNEMDNLFAFAGNK